jgi:UDP-N-acetyl-D-galactosamine dehydrogenase
LTFKEDCPDLRNTRVVDIVRELRAANAQVDIHDPWADAAEAKRELGIDLVVKPEAGAYDAVVLAVAHKGFLELPGGVASFCRDPGVVFDVKGVLPAGVADGRL